MVEVLQGCKFLHGSVKISAPRVAQVGGDICTTDGADRWRFLCTEEGGDRNRHPGTHPIYYISTNKEYCVHPITVLINLHIKAMQI